MRDYKYKLPNRCSLCGNKPITKTGKHGFYDGFSKSMQVGQFCISCFDRHGAKGQYYEEGIKCEKPIIKDDEFEILCHDCYHITGIDLKELIDFDGLLYLPLNTISGATDFHKVTSNGEVKITHYYRMLDYLPIVSLKGTINKQSFVFTIPAKFIIFMHPNMPYQYRWNEKKQDFIKEPK